MTPLTASRTLPEKDPAMPLSITPATSAIPTESLAGSVERVIFHSEETGFCVLRVKVRGHRDLVTVVGTTPTITPGE
jgi:exodeoxyribonuclease V alpha subunit